MKKILYILIIILLISCSSVNNQNEITVNKITSDQALEDFTGSGSAASSKSDLGSLKNTSGAFKNGLSTSGSASDALSVFSSSSELWSWFSQNTLNDLDHTSQYQNRNLLKSVSNEDQILDFYNLNNQGLIDWMHP